MMHVVRLARLVLLLRPGHDHVCTGDDDADCLPPHNHSSILTRLRRTIMVALADRGRLFRNDVWEWPLRADGDWSVRARKQV
jgi:hypothetical protein